MFSEHSDVAGYSNVHGFRFCFYFKRKGALLLSLTNATIPLEITISLSAETSFDRIFCSCVAKPVHEPMRSNLQSVKILSAFPLKTRAIWRL